MFGKGKGKSAKRGKKRAHSSRAKPAHGMAGGAFAALKNRGRDIDRSVNQTTDSNNK